MKKNLTSLLMIIAIAFAFTIRAEATNRSEILRAINWVENPTNQTHVGRFGELGPYQFRPATWKMHTSKPFNLAIRRQEADEVAVKHYEWIKRTFETAGVEVNSFNIALAWNSGVDSVLSGRVPEASYHYAERVTNLVDTFHESRSNLADRKAVSVESKIEAAPASNGADEIRFRILDNPPHFEVAAG
ncbi:MAG TPA: hypothetical protein VGM64_07515 [Lacunisphaera sp.]|jgi:hypothetical protein